MSERDGAGVLIDERELAAALRGLRADPAVFRDAVERRVREAEEAGEEKERDERELRAADGGWWRRAAAWLPAELVPGSLVGAGAKFSWKALPGLVALPALTFAMLAFPILGAFQALGSDSGERAQERLAAVRGWWREHRRAALLTLAVIAFVFLREPASAGVALLLVSTGVLAMLLARLRAAGFGRRADVALHCGDLLLALALWMGMLGAPWQALFPDEPSMLLGLGALALGGAACAVIALREKHATVWHLLTRSNGTDARMLLLVVVFVPWSALSLWGLGGTLWKVDRVQAVEQLRPWDRAGWEEAAESVAWLRAEGLEPDVAGLREHWLRQRERGFERHERTTGFLAAGIDLGFVASDEIAALAAEARGLMDEDGPLEGHSLRERADLCALVRCGTLTAAERERLGERLLASRDGGANPWVLERLAAVAALLDELGLSQRADELRPEVESLLRECWIPGGRFLSPAGFFARRWRDSDSPLPSFTHDAIDLMLRFGVPAEIDLAGVKVGLRQALRQTFPWQKPRAHQWEAQLALSELEGGLLPRQGWFARLAANRVLFAMLVLAGFCVAASLRAPRDPLPQPANATGGTSP